MPNYQNPAAFWKLKWNGQIKSFSDWNLTGLRRELVSLGCDKVTFTAGYTDYDTNTQFNYKDPVIIYRNDAQWFVGLVTGVRRAGGPQHYIHYEVSGPWWYFENLVYEQLCAVVYDSYTSLDGTINTYHPTTLPIGLPQGVTIDGFNPDPAISFYNSNDPASPHYYGNYTNYYESPKNVAADYQYNAFINPKSGWLYFVAHGSHVALNYFKSDNYFDFIYPLTRKISDEQITDALTWCNIVCEKQLGLPQFTTGSILKNSDGTSGGVDMPSSESRDQTVAEIIRNQLKLSPDAVTWFDYTQSPPVFNIRRRDEQQDRIMIATQSTTGGGGELNTVEYSIIDKGTGLTAATSASLVSAEVHPRYELVAPLVSLKYEYQNTVGNRTFTTVVFDKYPLYLDANGNPAASGAPTLPYAFGAIVSTINMYGPVMNGTTATVGCAVAPTGNFIWTNGFSSLTDPLYVFWRTQKNTLLGDPSVIIDSIAPLARTTNNPHYVYSGALAPWMGVSEASETIEATVSYHYLNGQIQTQNFSVDVVSTNAPLGLLGYYDSSGDVPAEPVPSGLARSIYNAVVQLQYDGQIVIEESECSGSLSINNTLNIVSAARPEWATMQAMIVSISEDIDNGRTTVAFGPTKHNGAGDIVEILRAMRTRKPLQIVNFQNGQPSGSGQVQLADKYPNTNPQYGPPVNPLATWANVVDPFTYLQQHPTDVLGIHAILDTMPRGIATPSGKTGTGGTLIINGNQNLPDLHVGIQDISDNAKLNP